jgi:hypothetical protein
MGDTHDSIDDRLRRFIEAQRVFFVATAPLAGDQHVNLSPKGLDSLRVLGARRVAYLDHHGSGVETIAHLRENGRIVLMVCAFDGPPRILRLHGHGRVLTPADPAYGLIRPHFPDAALARAIIDVDVTRVSTSCGFGVPLLRFGGDRSQLTDWASRKGEAGLRDYRHKKNARSIDGLAGLDPE